MKTAINAMHNTVRSHTYNAISLITVIQSNGEDINEGFKMEHQDVLNLLDLVKNSLLEIDDLNILAQTASNEF